MTLTTALFRSDTRGAPPTSICIPIRRPRRQPIINCIRCKIFPCWLTPARGSSPLKSV
jgi:hypothetical protein